MYGHIYSNSKNQLGKVANPARGQLNKENEHFSVPVVTRINSLDNYDNNNSAGVVQSIYSSSLCITMDQLMCASLFPHPHLVQCTCSIYLSVSKTCMG